MHGLCSMFYDDLKLFILPCPTERSILRSCITPSERTICLPGLINHQPSFFAHMCRKKRLSGYRTTLFLKIISTVYTIGISATA
jgi:hypothetical protein